ncbi:MAG: putative rane protein [Ramlibacter sp.]|nr:putative rane protein [Ramlibacter sp.]
MPIVHIRKVIAAVAIAAVLFGAVTILAAARVLLGAAPGYVVYLPLLRFNSIMGVIYVAVGVMAWRNLRLGVYGAAAICVLNLAALGAISYLYTPNGAIAGTSVQAMTFRTVVWLAFFFVLAWSSRRIAADGKSNTR